jgi:D-arabinose 1-dehydrogenase-like Zn-dependent alcohol dehydrogenase
VGLTKPKARVAGVDAAGRVEAVGANVRGLRPGDEVLGFCPGAFAEYACAEADNVVPKPVSLTFEQAAAVPMAGATALRGIRDVGAVRAGQRVLVNGAAGGGGTTPCRSRQRWARRSPGCAARATSSWCAQSAPHTSSTTRRRTSPTGARAMT